MTTTAQNIVDRAKSFNPLNATLASDTTEMLTRIQQMQQRVFTAVASLPVSLLGRCRFTRAQSITSSSAASARTVDLTTVSVPLERLLRVTLPSGTEVYPVTEFDVYAQLAPRYFIRGQTVIEVSNDWSATTGTVAIGVLYVFGATAITPSGNLSQQISIPDEWADLLTLPLARYFHQKDPGRDPVEYAQLDEQYRETWMRFLGYVTNYAGDMKTMLEYAPAPEAGR